MGLETLKYRRHKEAEDIDAYYRMQLIDMEIEYILVFVDIEPKKITYEIPPGIYELNDITEDFKENNRFKTVGKNNETTFATHPNIIFNAQSVEV